jgi:hypothetical protein
VQPAAPAAHLPVQSALVLQPEVPEPPDEPLLPEPLLPLLLLLLLLLLPEPLLPLLPLLLLLLLLLLLDEPPPPEAQKPSFMQNASAPLGSFGQSLSTLQLAMHVAPL